MQTQTLEDGVLLCHSGWTAQWRDLGSQQPPRRRQENAALPDGGRLRADLNSRPESESTNSSPEMVREPELDEGSMEPEKRLGTPEGLCFCCPGWSAMARSQLTATNASQVQVTLLPQPPN
ncbi:putative uncharacterized protein SPANXA2-OT1 [Plecturocebus cupreus]